MTAPRTHSGGYLLILVLMFGALFFVGVVAFLGYILTEGQVQEARYNEARARAIAEAGLDYYKWYLAHYPDDVTNGTGEEGPYVHEYEDPEGGTIGEFSLEIESNSACGEISAVDIYSTGYTTDEPNIERTVYARYARPTVSEYAFIINSNVWAGEDRTIVGPYHSNGIIRMDGTNNSTVTSGQEDWVCDGSLPCDPNDTGDTIDAVYGDGPNDELWTFPSTPINFTGLTVDLTSMQQTANDHGIAIGASGEYGYRLHFNGDNTFDLYVVDDTYSYEGYSSENGWQNERNVIEDDDFFLTYTIPEDCALIFIEDNVWLEGEIDGKVTVAAADVDTVGNDPSIILNDDITYTDPDTSGLLAIAEEDVLVGLVVPDDMELNGIFIAQGGRFGRNHYNTEHLPTYCAQYYGWWCADYDIRFAEYIHRDSLSITGTIVSNGRVGTQWVSGGVSVSGFADRYNSYDRNLVANPPPLAPKTSDNYTFIEWREVE